jgi:deoxyribonuclease-4
LSIIIKNKIGAHLSIKGSLLNIFKEADNLGIKTIACFTGSNLKYNYNINIDEEIVKEFRKKINDGYEVFSHACYLINIANRNNIENYNKSVKALRAELFRCNILGIKGIAFHPGSNLNRMDGLESIANTINELFSDNDFNTSLYIESSAGQGNTLPTFLEELKVIFDKLSINSKNKIGFVLDTCHFFAAGYDLSLKSGVDEFLLNFDKVIGLEYVKLIHLNDSKRGCGSKLDRHESIGLGKIGLDGIISLLKNNDIKNIPKILETPVKNYLDLLNELLLISSLIC